jgi:hypothetical protein
MFIWTFTASLKSWTFNWSVIGRKKFHWNSCWHNMKLVHCSREIPTTSTVPLCDDCACCHGNCTSGLHPACHSLHVSTCEQNF